MNKLSSLLLVFLFSVPLLMDGCIPYNVARYYPHDAMKEKLPVLQVQYKFTDAAATEIDSVEKNATRKDYSIKKEFKVIGQKSPWGGAIDPSGKDISKLYDSRLDTLDRMLFVTKWVEDFTRRKSEAFQIIQRDVAENICQPHTDKSYGKAVWEVVSVRNSSSSAWWIVSLPTLFTINLLGFPLGSQSADVSVNLEIFDLRDSSIARYSADGEGTSYIAAYWGYSYGAVGGMWINDFGEMTRAAFSKAVADALKKIKKELSDNANTLNDRLMHAANFKQ